MKDDQQKVLSRVLWHELFIQNKKNRNQRHSFFFLDIWRGIAQIRKLAGIACVNSCKLRKYNNIMIIPCLIGCYINRVTWNLKPLRISKSDSSAPQSQVKVLGLVITKPFTETFKLVKLFWSRWLTWPLLTLTFALSYSAHCFSPTLGIPIMGIPIMGLHIFTHQEYGSK